MSGDISSAGKAQVEIKPLIDAVFAEVNPIPVKSALNMMNRCNLEYRLPLCPPTNKTQFLLYDILKTYGLV